MSEAHLALLPATTGLRSFWMAGFEAGSQINHHGERIDLIAGTRHDQSALRDYQLLREFGLGVARDALRWHLIDRGQASLDFSTFLPALRAAQATGVQVIWSLHHYGSPDDLDIFSPAFVKRFVRYAVAAARLIREHSSEVPYFTPINEISFYSWAGSRNLMYPFAEGRDRDLKRQLVLATVEACHALRDVDPRCRFVYSDPIIHVCPNDDAASQREAQRAEDSQFEAWDMLAGRIAPELGGSENLLDVVGMNYYASNQWVLGGPRLAWEGAARDPRWRPLNKLMERVWLRYRRPLFLSETSHVGVGRGDWILEVAQETAAARSEGIPVEGICLFPILDRYDWDNPTLWHNSGLWDINSEDGTWDRVLNMPYALAIRQARDTVCRENS